MDGDQPVQPEQPADRREDRGREERRPRLPDHPGRDRRVEDPEGRRPDCVRTGSVDGQLTDVGHRRQGEDRAEQPGTGLRSLGGEQHDRASRKSGNLTKKVR
ncbi:hypothetical protein GCM10009565_69840 [Amycolatopsis albidoflavus]